MATIRLTFLYPHFFRPAGRWSEPAASRAVRKSRRKQSQLSSSHICCPHAAPFTTPSAGRQAAFAKRAGKAIEPLPLLDTAKSPPKPSDDSRSKERGTPDGKGAPKNAAQATSGQPPPSGEENQYPNPPATIELPPPQDVDPVTQTKKGSPMDEILHRRPPPDYSSSASPSTTPDPSQSLDTNSATTGSTTTTKSSTGDNAALDKPPPHLTPPPYVHHFDSYTLVKQLQAGGFTLEQSIVAMKAIRTLLASNLDVAQAGLVSKADVENETYLFRAACSELSAEVRNNRRVADEQLRQQRTLLQHEVDILAQRLNQELLTLNDSVRGMFNDRRMAVREEQKAVESRIQQINYKISVALNSDAKSNIEGLRWVLIRRSVLGIIFMAVLTLGTLRYATYTRHQRQKEAEQRAREAEQMRKHDGRQDILAAPEAAEILAAN
ncbi:hypothetical protein VTK56DRAFT_2560 [Thermocarpiscus australiensis]